VRVIDETAPDSIPVAAALLAAGNVAILPTDTLYGFSGIVPHSAAAIKALKGRGDSKPFIRLIAEACDIARYSDTEIPPELAKFWPGALTIVVGLRKNSADTETTVASDGTTETTDTTAAFRVPGSPWIRALISALGTPLYSTSVNRSGESPFPDAAAIEAAFADAVPLLVKAAHPLPGTPSTVVEVTASGEIRVIRAGAVPVTPRDRNAGSRRAS
jgi:L-threonylcarbamoyladenylate synthase